MTDTEQDSGPTASPGERNVSERKAPCPIIGIGTSAGGIEALQKLLPAVLADSGLGYVVIMHLSPEHESALAEILSRSAKLHVTTIENGVAVEPNHVYVAPPNSTVTMNKGKLSLSKADGPRALMPTSIDTFLVSLAEDQGENAACVILSGVGSDGTLGLRAIKEHGGLTLAQAHAEYEGMMRSAVSTGLVDFVLPAEQMAAKLVDHFRHLDVVIAKKGPDGAIKETTDYLAQICAVLRARTGHDFSGYKDKTMIRRVQRRMQVLQVDEVPQFLERLRKEPHEADLLFQDLLIGVTSFFRDAEAFRSLEKDVIPRLFEGKGADDSVRVWVPGCSTGEEAYSIAILLRECAPKSHAAPKLQIFGSDIDERALEIARVGRYPATIARDVSIARLDKYFHREDGTYRTSNDIRSICLFAYHDLLRDAPFSKLDLISCRNLLIYLGPELQSRVIPLFHYALREGGYLFLGSSENVTRHTRLFGEIDKPHRIFRRRPQADRRLPEFPLTTPDAAVAKSVPLPRLARRDDTLQAMVERQLLERYAPAYVIIDAEGDVLFASGRTGRYLELPAGAPTNNLIAMARRGLRLDLRSAVHRAVSRGESVVQRKLTVGTNGGRLTLDLFVQPLRQGSGADALYMVVFQDLGEIKPAPDGDPVEPGEAMESANVRQLEAELKTTKERLQTSTEELESANEELKSRNEELSSMNEELQSANEELETSKEELQSINEELQTVNTELHVRVDELSHANSDIANLLESTQIATIFLDRELRVKSFTPAAKDVFHLVESDTGRPIAHVRARFKLDAVEEDAARVLRTLASIERQVESDDGQQRYVMRMLPYRTIDNVIAGVVMTFMNATEVTTAEARINKLASDLRDGVASLETLLDLVPVGIIMVESPDARQAHVNRYGSRLLGSIENNTVMREIDLPLRLFVNEHEMPAEEQPLQRAIRTGESVRDVEARLLRSDGSALRVLISATPLFDDEERPRGAIAAIVDVSQRNSAEAARRPGAPAERNTKAKKRGS
jgi:two-component system, chemotaxis family, CheB/CheR fusion protein